MHRPMTPDEWVDIQDDVRQLAELMIEAVADQQACRLSVVLAALDVAMLAADVTAEHKHAIEMALLELMFPLPPPPTRGRDGTVQ